MVLNAAHHRVAPVTQDPTDLVSLVIVINKTTFVSYEQVHRFVT